MKSIIASVCLLGVLSSCSTPRAYTDSMKVELKAMFDKDQLYQNWDPKRLEDQKYIDSMNVLFNNVIRKNCEVVKQYNKDFGFPGNKKDGEVAGKHFWLIVQHSDHDVDFQEEILKEMKKGLKAGDVSSQNYAYLFDRVKKNKGLPQFYGTQVEYSGWDVVPYKLEYPEKVEKLRKEVGLDSLKTYLASFRN
ncbi:DUF6624 domain-containing protein [Flavobacterium saccharophilum]|uniref:Lipoprotein n=1 Tax=Flavobacterium saccharophilum TaxID=29534 RepID=A0A1M7A7K1_9FLAO|nr:DUF6624 domain-containing protein [Flavobacterium saccharophilum]SHL38707.1 hypothetical protein SAMN05444366_0551 [Flavobacterium saccharophilum]